MNVKIIMNIIYLSIIIGVSLLLTGLFIDKKHYENIIEKTHIFDVANLFLQVGIVSTAIVLILHANNVMNTMNLHRI